MTFGLVLDVIMGVTFTYLLLSLVCTGVNEMIAGLLNLRGKTRRRPSRPGKARRRR
jgi:hypothetical protein